jgi:hypothetical protein
MAAAVRAYWHRVRGFERNVKLYLTSMVLGSTTFALSSLLFNLYLASIGFDAAFVGLNNILPGYRGLYGSRLLLERPTRTPMPAQAGPFQSIGLTPRACWGIIRPQSQLERDHPTHRTRFSTSEAPLVGR